MALGYFMVRVRNVISNVVQELYPGDAENYLNHPWFSQFYVIDGAPMSVSGTIPIVSAVNGNVTVISGADLPAAGTVNIVSGTSGAVTARRIVSGAVPIVSAVSGNVTVSGGGGSLTGTFLQPVDSSADLTTYTFAAQNIGSASSDRLVVAAVAGRQSSARTIVSVTIGGVTAAELGTRGSSQNPLGIWAATVPTGTTADVVVTFSAAMLRCRVGLWAVTGGASLADSQFGTDTATVTGATGGFIIAAACTTGASSFTWTNATERFDGTAESFTSSGADATTVGSTMITATPAAASTNGIVVVALTP